jgi:hypothetical protein
MFSRPSATGHPASSTTVTARAHPAWFQATYDPLTLVRIVHEVTTIAAESDPRACRQADFNAAKAETRWADAPLAGNICKRLGIAWPRLLAVAHGPEAQWSRELGKAGMDRTRKDIALKHVLAALRQAAAQLKAPTITAAEYESVARTVIARSRRAHKHGGDGAHALPTLNQVQHVLALHELSWEQALERADLEPRRRAATPGTPVAELVRCFAGATGLMPRTRKQLHAWAAVAGKSAENFTTAAMRTAIAAAQHERAAAGHAALDVAPVALELVAPPPKWMPNGPDRKVRAGYWRDEGRIIEGLARAVGFLRPGEQLDQRSIQRIAQVHRAERIPSWSTVDDFRRQIDADFEDWRHRALELARARGTAPGSSLTGQAA